MSLNSESESLLHAWWGKTVPQEDGTHARHPLLHHCLDVGAVAQAWLEAHPAVVRHLATQCQASRNLITSLIVYLAIIHDLGKLLPRFQRIVPEAMGPALDAVRNGPGGSRPHHTALGLTLWFEMIRKDPALCPLGDDWQPLLEHWYQASFGHHGKPVEPLAALEWRLEESSDDDLTGAVAALHHCAFTVAEFPQDVDVAPSEPQRTYWKRASWTVAGIITLADWVASNTGLFEFNDRVMAANRYFHDIARPQAVQALRTCDLLDHTITVHPTLVGIFPFISQPRPLQEQADVLPLTGEPELHIIEDLTGSGKTEAALTLAARLNATGTARGIYVALPTMATANAMYRRVDTCLSHLYPTSNTEGAPSLALLHGRAGLALATTTNDEGGATCAAWLAESPKRRLLATLGVGTIDQALLGVLPNKHQSLRLLGLHGKVLIVDEVHACDTYVFGLLERLLTFHAAAGGSVILLSATLPQSQRQKLVKAWHSGRDVPAPTCTQHAYPLLTQCTPQGSREIAIPAHAEGPRSTATPLTDDDDAVIAALTATATAGGCACWIRNTVADAQATWARLRSASPHPERIHLFHARFTLGDRLEREQDILRRFGEKSTQADRAGHILIATQVVEQSLDLDFDLVASDIAPIDLLIQRAGRCQRHRRDTQGNRHEHADQRPPPRLLVFAPTPNEKPSEDWLGGPFSGSAAVYEPSLLWRTTMLLADHGAISVPDRARQLIEAVYDDSEGGPARPVPEGLMRLDDHTYSKALADRAMVLSNALRLDVGYVRTQQTWTQDTYAPTRLAEPTVTLRLARWDGTTLLPWIEDERFGWAMSECSIRRFHCRDQEGIACDTSCAAAIDLFRGDHRLINRHDIVILPMRLNNDGMWVGQATNQQSSPIQFFYNKKEGLRWES